MTNPLIEMLDDGTPPAFDRLAPSDAEPALDEVLAATRTGLQNLLERGHGYNWDNLIAPLETLTDRVSRVWAPISHMNAVMNSPGWREAYNACLPKLSDFHTELGQHEGLYAAIREIAGSTAFNDLDTAQQTFINHELRDFRLSGVDLAADRKTRFKEIAQRLSSLSSRFEENLLDATQAWHRQVTDPARMAGLPESEMAQAAGKAEARNLPGWLLTLDIPSYLAFMSFGEDRELRRELYEAFTTRASDQGPDAGRFDNTAIMEEIVALRHEMAQLTGFDNFADYSLATKMATSTDQVLAFIDDLAQRTLPQARTELKTLERFAREHDGLEKLEAWDTTFYSERYKESHYRISQEELRPYFPARQVIDGLFSVVNRLYGITASAVDHLPVWHEEVRVFDIEDANGDYRGRVYMDLYARDNKRSGAWMADCVNRRRAGTTIQHPIAFLTCNFTPPPANRPALLKHDEVLTLFHEFGHTLHHLLTRVDYAGVSGISGVAWDAVELPSQFMENWCWEREALDLFAAHYESGEKLPPTLFEKLLATRQFNAGLMMLRQLEFSLFDFSLHANYDPAAGARIGQTLTAAREQVALIKPPGYNRFAHSFAHIFAGGYAAGYYSYKWAEVLSADAFSAFEETGIFDAATGQSFLTSILERGGSADAMTLFQAFRGREPRIDALLRHSGLTTRAA